MQEIAPNLFPGSISQLLGDRVGHRFGDQGFSATRRPIEQHPFGRTEFVFREDLWMQKWEFDGITNLLQLFLKTTDVRIVDIRDFFQDQLFRFGLREFFDHVAGTYIVEQMISHTQPFSQQGIAQISHLLLVKMESDQGPAPF